MVITNMVYFQGVITYWGGDLVNKRSAWILLSVIALGLISLLGWGRYNYELAIQGTLSEEFVVNWVAAREFIINGVSPYHSEVTYKILTILDTDHSLFIGRVTQFTSPIYLILLLLPVAIIEDFSLAQAVWMSLQLILLVMIMLLSVKLCPTKPRFWIFGLLVATTFTGIHAIAPILTGSPILLATVILLLALLAIKNGKDVVGGIFLGLATIQLVYLVLPIVIILIWTLVHRKRLVALWFLGSVTLLTVIGVIVVSDWPLQFLRILSNYSLYYPTSFPRAGFRVWLPGIGMLLSWLVTITTSGVLLFEWWVALRNDNRHLLWVIGLTFSLGMWIGLPTIPENLVLLLLPLILCVNTWSERWRQSGNVIAAITMLIIFVWEWWLVIKNVDSLSQVDSLKLLIPLPAICLIGLYWVRDTFLRSKNLYIDEIRSKENA